MTQEARSAATTKVVALMRQDATDPWDDEWELIVASESGFVLGVARSRLEAVDIMGDAFEEAGRPGRGEYRLSWRRRDA